MNTFLRMRATARLAVCAAVAAGALFPADSFAERMSEKEQDAFFIAAKSDMGGAVLEPLIRKCNNLRDSDVPLCSKDRKGLIMKRLSGSIGPINYTMTTHTKKVTLPHGFKQAFGKYKTLMRLGHAKAYAEAGAFVFAETMKGEFGMDDRCAFKYFQKAAQAGDIDGAFMYAFCLYYGIGSSAANQTPDRRKACEVLVAMKKKIDGDATKSSTASKLLSSGWVARRLAEAGTVLCRK